MAVEFAALFAKTTNKESLLQLVFFFHFFFHFHLSLEWRIIKYKISIRNK